MKRETVINYFGSVLNTVDAMGHSSRTNVDRWLDIIPEKYARRLHAGTRSKEQMQIWFPDGYRGKGKLTFDPSLYDLVA